MNDTSKTWARPQSLAEVAAVAESRADFHNHLRDFLHAFEAAHDREKIATEPAGLRAKFAGGEIADAYLAAVAVDLSCDLAQPRPAWTRKPAISS